MEGILETLLDVRYLKPTGPQRQGNECDLYVVVLAIVGGLVAKAWIHF